MKPRDWAILATLIPVNVVSGLLAIRILMEVWETLPDLTEARLTGYIVICFFSMIVWAITSFAGTNIVLGDSSRY